MDAVDTNVLLYAHDPRDPVKQQAAIALIESLSDAALLWQVACEYLAASRKLEPFGFRPSDAWKDVQDLRMVWTTILPSWESLDRAGGLIQQHGMSFWDAMIVAACQECGITRLYSEDFGSHLRLDRIEITNPFRST
jgi:predicted nucleic acid-binding protein